MKNEFEVRGAVTAIILSSREYGAMETLISTDRLNRAMEITGSWYVHWSPKTRSFYCCGKEKVAGKWETLQLHRWISNCPKDMWVDHRNNKTLVNTDDNLRKVTPAQNGQNHKGRIRNGKSGIRGVSWHKQRKKWCVQIGFNGDVLHIGLFESIQEAEQAAKTARANYMPFSKEAAGIDS